ncbi:MAG: hypothetical protein H0U75_03280 [Legionella sp.]|nr:hypothetical protein [Legionella sp.]
MIIKILALILAWYAFYRLLVSRNKRAPKLKATIITLIFASLIFNVANNLYGRINRSIFSMNAGGEVALSSTPLKIPANQDAGYCNKFSDEHHQKITRISERQDGKYCGEFWNFKTNDLKIPYKILNHSEILYWASPTLKIIAPRPKTNDSLNT